MRFAVAVFVMVCSLLGNAANAWQDEAYYAGARFSFGTRVESGSDFTVEPAMRESFSWSDRHVALSLAVSEGEELAVGETVTVDYSATLTAESPLFLREFGLNFRVNSSNVDFAFVDDATVESGGSEISISGSHSFTYTGGLPKFSLSASHIGSVAGGGITMYYCGTPIPPCNRTPDDAGNCNSCQGCNSGRACPPEGALGSKRQPALSESNTGGRCRSGCGGGGSSSSGGNAAALDTLFKPGSLDLGGNLGQGGYSNYDLSVKFHRICQTATGNRKIYRACVFDPCTGQIQEFINGDGSSSFTSEAGNAFADFSVSASDLEDLTDASFTLVRRLDGYRFEQLLKNTSHTSGGGNAAFFEGRIERIQSPGSRSINFTYLTDGRQDANSPFPNDQNSQLRFATISDSYGVTIAPEYQFNFGAWRWSKAIVTGYDVEPIEIDYGYSDGSLASVQRDGVLVTSYSISSDDTNGTTFLTYEDHTRWGPDRKSTIVYSGSSQANEAGVFNQFEGFVVQRKNAAGETYSTTTEDPENEGMLLVTYRGTSMQWVPGQSLKYVGDAATGYASAMDATEEQVRLGIVPMTTDQTGYVTRHQYDSNGNRIKTFHDMELSVDAQGNLSTSDATSYELMLYDENNLMVYQRDRAGFVTVTERDEQGRVTRRIRGVKDNDDSVDDSGFMVPPGALPLQDVYRYGPNGLVAWEATNAYQPGNFTVPEVAPQDSTAYEYDSNDRLVKISKPIPAGQSSRPTVQYTWVGAEMTEMINERGFATNYQYDDLGRLVNTTYHDASTEQTFYDDANRRMYTKDRNGVVQRVDYDAAWRQRFTFRAYGTDASLLDGQVDSVVPRNQRQLEIVNYRDGETLPFYRRSAARVTAYTYDHRRRVFQESNYPRSGTFRTTTYNYSPQNLLFSTEEQFPGYLRRTYRAYSDDRQAVRTIQTRLSSLTYDNNTALLNAVRDNPNMLRPNFVISDAVRDLRGNVVQLFDARGTETRSEYDSLSRMTRQIRGFGLNGIALETRYVYDAEGNLDSTQDPTGAITKNLYDAADNVEQRTQAFGTPSALTTSYQYDPDGYVLETTLPNGGVNRSIRTDCCGRSTGMRDGEGDGRFVNQDRGGRTVHTAVVEDFDFHTDPFNPYHLKTVSETTTRYFPSGKPQYRTRWNTPVGNVEPDNPPIAGLDGVAVLNGVTTQFTYDTYLGDGIGLDGDGVIIDLLGGGTATITLSQALEQLSLPIANGGAGITFTSVRPGSASLTLSPDEKTMQLTISDGLGRTVMAAQMYGPRATGGDTTPNSLITWNCMLHEQTHQLTQFGATESVKTIDQDGRFTEVYTDGFGWAVGSRDKQNRFRRQYNVVDGQVGRSFDAFDKLTIYNYDQLGRLIRTSDPNGNVRRFTFDTQGRPRGQIDAFGKATFTDYDELSRVIQIRDRMGRITHRSYDTAGRKETIRDAQNKTTTYSYDFLNRRILTQLPDNSTKAFKYDAAGKILTIELDSGRKQTNTWNLSGTLKERKYTNANGGDGGDGGTDTFGYDEFQRQISSISRDNVSTAREYNQRGLLESESMTYGGMTYPVSYQYTDRGQVEQITYPSGKKVDYTYTTRQQLDTLAWQGQQFEDRRYNNNGDLLQINRLGQLENRRYDDGQRLTSISNAGIDNLFYQYDKNNNKTDETIGGVMSRFSFTTKRSGAAFPDGYDFEDRFMYFTQGNNNTTVSDTIFTRSNIGNITGERLVGTGLKARSYSDAHELTSVGSDLQTFDADGNLTGHYSGMTMGYDAAGMLESATVDNAAGFRGTVAFGYTADGKRAFKRTTPTDGNAQTRVYVYAGANCVAEYFLARPAPNPQIEYVYGDGIDSLALIEFNNTTAAVLRNQQWSVTALMDVDNPGTVLERYAYDKFGKRTILTPNGANVRAESHFSNFYGYTSRRHDVETGLMYYRARYYDPATSEFISRDPLEYVDGMSLYRAYFVPGGMDPWGLFQNGIPSSMPVPPVPGQTVHNPLWPWPSPEKQTEDAKWHITVLTLVVPGPDELVIVYACRSLIRGGKVVSKTCKEIGRRKKPKTCNKEKPRKRGSNDPHSGKKHNPGKDKFGKCKPCKPDSPIWVANNRDGHGGNSCHQIIYNQTPTCDCFPSRISLPCPPGM